MNWSVGEETAKAVGMTHEGTAFGAPAWVAIDQYGTADVVAKNKLFGWYMDVANFSLEFLLRFAPDGFDIEFIKARRRL